MWTQFDISTKINDYLFVFCCNLKRYFIGRDYKLFAIIFTQTYNLHKLLFTMHNDSFKIFKLIFRIMLRFSTLVGILFYRKVNLVGTYEKILISYQVSGKIN